MPEYLLAVHHDYDNMTMPPPEEMEAAFKAVAVFNEEVQAAGAWVFAGGLQPPSTASVVRAEGAEVLTTDGPYAETKEHIGGFWVIDVADLDAALDWAAKGSAACRGSVEVRPFQVEPED